MKTITQRDLRHRTGMILRAVERGESFVLIRNGVPVGELRPLPRRRFVPIAEARAALARASQLDFARLRHDIDALMKDE